MNLRIISGKFGGRTIKAPDGRITHPMGDRVRSALFNIINSKLSNAEVLDVFAGTGSLGLESLSRGAKSAIFVEKDRVASNILKENIDLLNVSESTKVIKVGVATWLEANEDKKFDIIFADPPYNNMQFSTVKKLPEYLKDGGMLIVSYPEKTELPELEGVEQIDDRNYGGANLRFWRK